MLKHLITILIILNFTYTGIVFAKVRGLSTMDSISSKILNEERELLVHLPNNYYENTELNYPVLYLLDGQRNLNHTAGTLDLLNQSSMAQEMIIIAITSTYRTRDLTPTYDESYNKWGISGGADNFIDFMEKELIPYVNKNYRSNSFKILSGHSFGGLLVIHALQSRPQLFQAHFAFSPSLWWHDEVVLKDTEKFLASTKELNNYLYINMGNEGGNMLSTFQQYKKLLNTYSPKGFSYNADLVEQENHNTTALIGQSLAYRYLYSTLQCPKEIIEQGLPAIEKYFKIESEKYGYQMKPGYRSINDAGYAALKKKDIVNAIKIFEFNVKNYPNKADAYDSLADGFEANGELSKALNMMDIAIKKSLKENIKKDSYITHKANLLSLINKTKLQSGDAKVN